MQRQKAPDETSQNASRNMASWSVRPDPYCVRPPCNSAAHHGRRPEVLRLLAWGSGGQPASSDAPHPAATLAMGGALVPTAGELRGPCHRPGMQSLGRSTVDGIYSYETSSGLASGQIFRRSQETLLPSSVNPRYRICGTMCDARINLIKSRTLIFKR
jgi:hypothetical protein